MNVSTYKQTLAPLYHKKFWNQGYLLIPNFFTSQEGQKITTIANELNNYPEEKGKWMIYHEKTQRGKQKARIENIVNYHPELGNLIHHKITPTLEQIYQKPMNLFKDKMNWKKAFGKGFQAHQDQPAWADFPPSRFVSVALFGNRTTQRNGCLEFATGEHYQGIMDYDMNSLGELTPVVEESLQWEPIETTSRDLLMFDSYVPHRSKSNKTDSERRIFYFTYNVEEEGDFYQEYIDRKRKEFPPDIEREEGQDVKIKGSRYNLANPIE